MFKISFSTKSKKQLRLISKIHHKQALREIFIDIKENPLIGKPLERELTRRFSYRVGVYRVIYIVDFKDKVITIITAKHRGVVYQ